MDLHDQKVYFINRVKQLIDHPQLREFVLKALELAPDYIWEINASTSGNHHHGESQTEHVLQALALAECLAEILEQPPVQAFIPPEGPSLLYAIVALHDLYKCGLPGQECRREDGSLATDPLHPIYPIEALKNVKVWDADKKQEVTASSCWWWSDFAEGVMGHSGPWSPAPFDWAALRDLRNFTLLGFLCDYFASRKGVQIAY